MGTLVKLAEAAVAKAEELETALVEDYLNEVAAPEELAPVKDFSAEEVAAPVEFSPVKEIAAPVNDVAPSVTDENEEVEVNAMDDADKSKKTTLLMQKTKKMTPCWLVPLIILWRSPMKTILL